MTRINVVPVRELSQKHLIAEYREITRLPGNLQQSLNRKGKPFSKDEIPTQYVLGPGHVKFFYDKMHWLAKRFDDLVDEMMRRGYDPKFREGAQKLAASLQQALDKLAHCDYCNNFSEHQVCSVCLETSRDKSPLS